MNLPEFEAFPKIARLNREMVVKEKLDGSNATVFITPELSVHAGSKNQWITPEADNYGFAAWVRDNAEDLKKLGPGWHRGEWHGAGIQKNPYGLPDKRFALFDHRYHDELKANLPSCCSVVPVIYRGPFEVSYVNYLVDGLADTGSVMYPGHPCEGVVVWLPAAQTGFKVTTLGDEVPKGEMVARLKKGLK